MALVFSTSCDTNERTINQGPAVYGDTLVMSTPEPVKELFPLYNTTIYSHKILTHIFDPLFKLDAKSNVPEGNLVKKFRWVDDGKVLLITLREGIEFQDDPCFEDHPRELTSTDVKFTLDMACSRHPLNQSNDALIAKIEGALEHYKEKQGVPSNKGVSGITILNEYQLKITLNAPYISFLTLLTSTKYSVFSKRAFEFYGDKIVNHPIGTGPFQLSKIDQKECLLTFNPSYWKKDKYDNQLPYLDALSFKISTNKEDEFNSFQKRKVDILSELPSHHLNSLLGDLITAQRGGTIPHKVKVIPGSRISLIVFNPNCMPFKDTRVRQAFDMVMNRDYICEEILNGDGIPAKKGLAPKSIFYNNDLLPNKVMNVVQAQKLMLACGYNAMHPFPKLKFYVAGKSNSSTYQYCKFFADDLKKYLSVDVEVIACTAQQRDQAVASNKADMWKIGWAPDYPDPEGYFSLFYSKNPELNKSNALFPRLNSAIFDFNFDLGIEESDPVLRNNYFTNCDALLQEELIVLPVMYEDFVLVLNLECRNVFLNSLGMLDLSECYIKPL